MIFVYAMYCLIGFGTGTYCTCKRSEVFSGKTDTFFGVIFLSLFWPVILGWSIAMFCEEFKG